jgi:hypothetical protein
MRFQVGCTGKAALEFVFSKELLVQQLYKSEVQGLVYHSQSRALGKKIVTQEMPVGTALIYALLLMPSTDALSFFMLRDWVEVFG